MSTTGDNSERTDNHGRIAAIDYGTVRVGIAISDSNRIIASPYENYTRGGRDADTARFQRLVDEEGITLFVVGLPVHMSGDESAKSQEARQFGAWLEEITGVPVTFFDERYTSRLAEDLLVDANLTKKQRRKRKDMLAAQLILAGYLEHQPSADDGNNGLG